MAEKETNLAAKMNIIPDPLRPERSHGAVIWFLADVVARFLCSRQTQAHVKNRIQFNGTLEKGKAVPVPQESIFEINPLYGSFLARDWKTPSDMVERHMLPRQTKRTEMGSGCRSGIFVVVMR